jgi:diguanylate cyclase (GGDEF)-like protein
MLRYRRGLDPAQDGPEAPAGERRGERLSLARRLESAFEKLARISRTDPLTHLANRRHFEEVLERFYHQSRRYNRPLSLVMLDVDFLKAVNDAGGHRAGDELLKLVADAVKDICRKADLPARFGGDEFAILLPETLCADAQRVAERIREAVCRQPIRVRSADMNVTVSAGVTDLNAGGIDGPDAMIASADRALYTAKELGRNRVVLAHELDGLAVAAGGNGGGNVDVLYKKLAGLDGQFKGIFLQAVEEVVQVLEERDPHMADHARKVQRYAVLIAEQMELPDRVLQRIEIAAMLHDIGMLALPDAIVLAPGELTAEQAAQVRRHPLLSVRIMERMQFLEQEIPAVRYHHERCDGKGYPEGIAGAAIPLTARILAVADTFDAITSARSFRPGMSREAALAELRRAAGTQLDPSVVKAFLAVAERLGESLMEAPPRQTGGLLREVSAMAAAPAS